MINHYLNLIGIDEWVRLKNNANFHCDSVSLKIALKLIGINAQLNPGSSKIDLIQKNKNNGLFLLSGPNKKYPNSIVLPQFNHPKDLPDQLVNNVEEQLISNHLVFIGVSSPKQNFLAEYLSELGHHNTFYCVGAVLDNKSYGVSAIRLTSGLGLEWVVNICLKPARTFGKLRTILNFYIRFLAVKSYRIKLREKLIAKF